LKSSLFEADLPASVIVYLMDAKESGSACLQVGQSSACWCLIINDERQSSMKTLRIIFQLLRRCLMGLFIAYWVIFIFYTVEKFVTGGSNAVVGWYRHIDSSVVQRGDGLFFTKWSWEKFLVRQFAILAITLALYFVERRSKRLARNQDD